MGDPDREFSYVLPVRLSAGDRDLAIDLGAYLDRLAEWCEDIIVVDGSPGEIRAANAQLWRGSARLEEPDPARSSLNGKVAGVLTGIDLARHERIVIADDDVRYDPASLMRTVALLAGHDLVRPQNYFSPVSWHASWDTARSLLNRATVGADFPGTLAVRRSTLHAAGGYDGDVLFENLELIRTIRAHGGSEISPPDLYVSRVPPDVRHFFGQRVRQAYDDFAMPGRMAIWLAILPTLIGLTPRYGARPWVGASAVAMALAERGRRLAGGARFFGPAATALAPVWLLERSCCAWIAVLQRLRQGGTPYSNGRIRVAAHSERTLRERAVRERPAADASLVADRVPQPDRCFSLSTSTTT